MKKHIRLVLRKIESVEEATDELASVTLPDMPHSEEIRNFAANSFKVLKELKAALIEYEQYMTDLEVIEEKKCIL